MAYDVPAAPVIYRVDLEKPEVDEAETLAGLNEALATIGHQTYADTGHAQREVHAKCHGLLTGRMTVPDGLPPELAQGLFSTPGDYEVIVRLSTVPGDMLPDKVSTPRGMALKVIGVNGLRLPGAEAANTQDFVLVNGPAFGAPTAKKFLGNLKMLAKTTDKMEGTKVATSAVMRGVEQVIEAFGGKSPTVITLGGHPETNILGETFYSQVPLRYGEYVAKVAVVPVSAELTALTNTKLDLADAPNGIRAAVIAFFTQHAAIWEVRVQLCTDLDKMPIEDASVIWPEDASPYRTVARIAVPMQSAWDDERSPPLEDALAFSPWQGLEMHRPLGSVMRARKQTYELAAARRARLNHRPIHEPASLAEVAR